MSNNLEIDIIEMHKSVMKTTHSFGKFYTIRYIHHSRYLHMIKNISIKARLIFVVSLLGIELVAGAAIGLFSLSKANDDLLSLYNDDVVCLGQLDHIIRGLNLNQLNIAEAVSVEPNKVNNFLDEVEKQKLSIDIQWKSYRNTRMDNDERQEAEKFAAVREKFVSEALQPAIVALRRGDTEQAAAIVHGPLKDLFLPVRTSIDKLLQIQLDDSKKMQQQSQAAYELVRNICLVGVCLGLIVSGVIGAFLIKSIVKPLNKAVEVATAVANGDLTHEIAVTSNDETGRLMLALSDMSRSLSQIVGQVRAGTDIIATASGEIAAGNLDLSARTEQQAASLEETASSMEELSSTVKQNAENARQANILAMSASEVAAKGGSVMSEVVTTMKDINTSATKIAEIINVIEGISFQTNILALNAAVEAARAGEEGRGFAVVAGEVRSLAHRSAEAAKQVKALINESVEKVTSGSELVNKAGVTMTQIVASVDMVTNIMSEITSASIEQTAGIDQVARSIIQMDHSTQQNAALVEEASAAAQALHEQADTLTVTVGTFRLGRQGDTIAAASVGNVLVKGQPLFCLTT